MRVCAVLSLVLLLLVGLSAAQETNFSTGPQYLMTSGSPLFARSLATPSLSLGEQPAPTIWEAATSSTALTSEAASTIDMARETALISIYYGVPLRESIVEISFGGSSGYFAPMPASILEEGVTESVEANALKLRGIGVTLPEASAYWKAHKPATTHRYTNADVARVREKEEKK